MTKFLARASKIARVISSRLALIGLKIGLSEGKIAGDLYLAGGVQFKVTDGGVLCIEDGVSIDRFSTIIVKRGSLKISRGAQIGIGVVIVSRNSVLIGQNALIAEYVTIRDQDHSYGGSRPTSSSGFTSKPVQIGENVWLGAKVTVTKGVTIGNNVIVGANSVVTKDLPDNCVAVGAPARVVRRLTAGERHSNLSE